jgi:hypothetical protein
MFVIKASNYINLTSMVLGWLGGRPFDDSTFPFLAFPKTLAFINIGVL